MGENVGNIDAISPLRQSQAASNAETGASADAAGGGGGGGGRDNAT